MKMKMLCGCYLNNVGFIVGRKYLHLVNAYTDKKIGKVFITNEVKADLQKIKDTYSIDDVRRTEAVINRFHLEYVIQRIMPMHYQKSKR